MTQKPKPKTPLERMTELKRGLLAVPKSEAISKRKTRKPKHR